MVLNMKLPVSGRQQELFLPAVLLKSCVMQGQGIIANPAMKKMKKLNETLDTVQLQKHIKEAMDKSGMAQKGVKLVDYTGTPTVKMHDVIQKRG